MTASRSSPGKVKSFLRLVAIEHSVFALPFAYLSALIAMTVTAAGVHWVDLLLITVAMVGGAHLRDGGQPDHRPPHRRAQPAYRATASWSPGR